MRMPNPLAIGFNVPFHEAIKAAQKRDVVLPDVYYGELQGLARQQAFSVAGIASLDQLEQVRNSLSAGLQRGISFNKWKKEILENGVLDLPAHRLDNIFRTNIQSNYNRGRWEKLQRTKATRPYLMYDAINDSRVRPAHLALDGIIRAVDDGFWDAHAPSNGYRCRCRLISLSEKQAQSRSGGDNGTNKPIDTVNMQPDKGWGYNPGADLTKGVESAIASRQASKIKAVMVEKVEGSAYWENGTTQSYWHDAAFIETSIDIKKAIRRFDGEFAGVTGRSEKGAYYQFQKINMPSSKDIKNIGDKSTWRHEYGHFLDQMLGRDKKGYYRSYHDDFNGVMEAETKELLKNSGFGRKSKAQQSILESIKKKNTSLEAAARKMSSSDRTEYISKAAKKVGFNEQVINAFIDSETVFDSDSGIGVDVRKMKLLQGLEDKNPHMFFRSIYDGVDRYDAQAMYKKGQTGKFSDLVGSASKNKMLGHGHGGVGGHSDSYLKHKGRPETEVFANLTALLGNGDFWVKTVETFYPVLTKKYRKILSDEV
jgi:SPP1 gp7 family putative phage head morphogenesis protein